MKTDIDATLTEGGSEVSIEDVIAIVCLFNFYNRLLDGHVVKGSDSIYAFPGEHLSKRGYNVPWFINWIAPMSRRRKKEFIATFSK